MYLWAAGSLITKGGDAIISYLLAYLFKMGHRYGMKLDGSFLRIVVSNSDSTVILTDL